MKKLLTILAIIVLSTNISPIFAQDDNADLQTDQTSTATTLKKASLTKNYLQNQYNIAFQRFLQSNVKAAYSDYSVLIETMAANDYAYMNIAEKMAELGFFDLSDEAAAKITDKDYSYIILDDIQRYYFPNKKLKKEDELYLAEIYSNIIYNDQSLEATDELVKNTQLLSNSDYANYIAALGYLKSNNLSEAQKFINAAIAMNGDNLNYQKLKAEILAHGIKPKEALAIVEMLKHQPLNSKDFSDKINSIEQYILYKTEKKDIQRSYHLGYYYYYEGELTKSIRTLQIAALSKKKTDKDIYALISRVYYDMNEFEKAQDNAQKAYKLNNDNVIALNVLGDLSYRNKDYKNALKYYKKAAGNDKKTTISLVNTAKTYKQLGENRKALEIYSKILKTYSNCYIAYYETALSDKTKELAYLKKTLAVNTDFNGVGI